MRIAMWIDISVATVIIFELDTEGDSRSHGSDDHNARGMYWRKREACPERDAARVHSAAPADRESVTRCGPVLVYDGSGVRAVGSRGGRQSRPTSRTPEIKCSESLLPEQRFSSRPRLSVIFAVKITKIARESWDFMQNRFQKLIYILDGNTLAPISRFFSDVDC